MLTTYIKSFPVYKNLALLGLWLILAQFSFLTTLNLPYQGEEGVYTITSLEMAFNREWFIPTLYGENYARPPLFNWLILGCHSMLGAKPILIASRLVTGLATTLTSLVLMGGVKKLFNDRVLALFSGLIYLSGDVLFRRGWLAYADPLFAFFTFSAMVCLWMSLHEKKLGWLYWAVLSLVASFLTKAITGYVFYGIAAIILYWRHANRALLLKPHSVVIHILMLLFPLIWNKFVSKGSHVNPMLQDVINKLNFSDFVEYLSKIFLYPIDTLVRWFPVSILLLYFTLAKINKKAFVLPVFNSEAKVALWILGANYIPYWLAPQSHIRYLMPLYPLLALIMAYMVWNLGKEKVKIVYGWLIVGILLRYVAGIFIFPYYEKQYRGNYQAIAKDILTIVQNEDLYVEDYSATGLSIVAYLDEQVISKKVLVRPPSVWKKGFLITNTVDIPNTEVSKTYQLGRHSLYLLWKGNRNT